MKSEDARDLQANIFPRNTLDEVAARVAGNLERMACGAGIVLVAELNGEIIGNMALKKEAHPLYAHRASVEDVVVCHRFWRRGIARRLFEACKERARADDVKIIQVSVRGGEPAEEVYRKLGFVEYGRLPGGIVEPWSGNVFDEVFLYTEV